jgi:hypothetical protein
VVPQRDVATYPFVALFPTWSLERDVGGEGLAVETGRERYGNAVPQSLGSVTGSLGVGYQ